MLWLTLLPFAFAREVVLRNDQAWDDSFGEEDRVVWLAYPACAVAVLEPEPEDYPLEVHTVLVYLGSSLGNQDRQSTMLTMSMQVLEEGEEPRLVGYNDWDWPETAFYVTVSSEYLNGLYLDDPGAGIYPLTIDHGRLAVFVCAPDPSWEGQYVWPCESEGEDCSGLVVETGSPSAGSWIVTHGAQAQPITSLGVEGAWVIRALAEGPELDTGGGDSGLQDTDSEPQDTDPDPPTLSVDAVVPSQADLGQSVDITIQGEAIPEGSQVSIGGLWVSDIVRISDTELQGRSPAALPEGLHDVVLVTQAGESAGLPGGFLVVSHAAGPCGCGAPAAGSPWALLLTPLWWRRRRERSH